MIDDTIRLAQEELQRANQRPTEIEGELEARTAELNEINRLAQLGIWRLSADRTEMTWSNEIYRLIGRALESGLAVVVVSTDFEEIAHICHRALVFNRGRIIAELSGAGLTTEAVITAASASEAA